MLIAIFNAFAEKDSCIDKFTCKNGNCINAMWQCDGDDDCEDGSDEQDANCTTTGVATCDSKEFPCSSRLESPNCIHISWHCDGDEDCADGSDEEDCKCEHYFSHSRPANFSDLIGKFRIS